MNFGLNLYNGWQIIRQALSEGYHDYDTAVVQAGSEKDTQKIAKELKKAGLVQDFDSIGGGQGTSAGQGEWVKNAQGQWTKGDATWDPRTQRTVRSGPGPAIAVRRHHHIDWNKLIDRVKSLGGRLTNLPEDPDAPDYEAAAIGHPHEKGWGNSSLSKAEHEARECLESAGYRLVDVLEDEHQNLRYLYRKLPETSQEYKLLMKAGQTKDAPSKVSQPRELPPGDERYSQDEPTRFAHRQSSSGDPRFARNPFANKIWDKYRPKRNEEVGDDVCPKCYAGEYAQGNCPECGYSDPQSKFNQHEGMKDALSMISVEGWICNECGKKFKRPPASGECPKCGGTDIDLAEPERKPGPEAPRPVFDKAGGRSEARAQGSPNYAKCPKCGAETPSPVNECPDCGAEMEAPVDWSKRDGWLGWPKGSKPGDLPGGGRQFPRGREEARAEDLPHVMCRYCDEKFDTQEELEDHYRWNKNHRGYVGPDRPRKQEAQLAEIILMPAYGFFWSQGHRLGRDVKQLQELVSTELKENDFVQTPLGLGQVLNIDSSGGVICKVEGTTIGSEYGFARSQVRKVGERQDLTDPSAFAQSGRSITESRWARFQQARLNEELNEGHQFTDRYQALGIPYPDPRTVCRGQCEGTGWIPIKAGETDSRFRTLWNEAHAKAHEEPCDGWHFVRCPDCAGTGKRQVEDMSEPESPEEEFYSRADEEPPSPPIEITDLPDEEPTAEEPQEEPKQEALVSNVTGVFSESKVCPECGGSKKSNRDDRECEWCGGTGTDPYASDGDRPYPMGSATTPAATTEVRQDYCPNCSISIRHAVLSEDQLTCGNCYQLIEIIRKVKGGYSVFSHTGKRLSKPSSKAHAQKRLRQVEYFKHHG